MTSDKDDTLLNKESKATKQGQTNAPTTANSDSADVAKIVQQLEDLVKISLECEQRELKPDVSFVEVHKKLLQIQKDIQQFQDSYNAQLADMNLKPEDVRPTPDDIAALDPKQRKVFEKMETLRTSCEDARERLYQSMKADPEGFKNVKKELTGPGKEKIRRKGKFKGMGGKQGWLPT